MTIVIGSMCPYIPDLNSNYVVSLLIPLHSPDVRSAQYTILYGLMRTMDLKHFQTRPIYAAGPRHWKATQAPNLRQLFHECGMFELEPK